MFNTVDRANTWLADRTRPSSLRRASKGLLVVGSGAVVMFATLLPEVAMCAGLGAAAAFGLVFLMTPPRM